MITLEKKLGNTFDTLKERFGYTNLFEAPRLTKVVVSTGVGSLTDKGKIKLVEDRLAKITGQKPSPRPAKRSIATFKTRQGDVIGFQVTLRGKRKIGFVEKLLAVALPRTRDFRGIQPSVIDAMGNCTIGIREHTIFPETADEELKDVFGLAVTLVTTARKPEEAHAFFEHLGIPFARKQA